MPLTGMYAWKEGHLTPIEQVDRFFNLLEHALDGGISIEELYSREYFKAFLHFVLLRSNAMAKLHVTNIFRSTVVLGDPGVLAVTLKPKEQRTLVVTEAQKRRLIPDLERLQKANWVTYSWIEEGVAPVAAKPAAPPPAPPAPPAPPPAPVVAAPPPPPPAPEPVQEPVPEPTPEPAAAAPVEPVAEEAAPAAPAEPAVPPPPPSKPSFFKKNRRE